MKFSGSRMSPRQSAFYQRCLVKIKSVCLPRIPSLSTTGTLIADLVDALSLLASTSAKLA